MPGGIATFGREAYRNALRLCQNGCMNENIERRGGSALSNLGGKALAVGVLLIAAWVLIKLAIGVVSAVFWAVVAIAAVVAVIWALNRLL
jgi:hypothetical protein